MVHKLRVVCRSFGQIACPFEINSQVSGFKFSTFHIVIHDMKMTYSIQNMSNLAIRSQNMTATPFDGHVQHFPAVIPNADEIFSHLLKVDWYPFPLRKGKNSSRTLCCHAIQHYEVGNIIEEFLRSFFKELSTEIEVLGMFGNYYPDGEATLPYHKDQYNADVVSLSFGSKRLFNFKTAFNGTVVKPSFYLSHGDVIMFDQYMNERYHHGIPLQSQIKEPRINVTCFVRFAKGDPFIVQKPSVESDSESELSDGYAYDSDGYVKVELVPLKTDK